jgi:hypothetical protein
MIVPGECDYTYALCALNYISTLSLLLFNNKHPLNMLDIYHQNVKCRKGPGTSITS